MPLQVSEHGERNAVIKHIESLVELGSDGKPAADQRQANNLKTFLIAEIRALAPEFNGVNVTADANAHPGGRTGSHTIIPQKLRL